MRSIALLLALSLGAAACGSTVSNRVASRSATDELSGASPAASANGSSTDATGGGSTVIAGGPSRVGAGATNAAAAARPPVTLPPGAARDKTPIKLGVLYVNGGNEVIAAGFGNTPVSFGDGQLEAKAVADDINARGGAGGRKIELAFGKVEAYKADGPGLQAACESLIQDHKVFAIMSVFNVRSLLAECAAKNKVLLMSTALGGGDDVLYGQFKDWLYTPTQLSLNREQRLVLETARAAGRITSKSKVGVLIQDDDPQFNRVYENTISPMLKSWGVPHQAAHIAQAGDTSGISGAVLRFASDGVSQVLFSAGNGGIPAVFFMQTAEQQNYRPAYNMGDSSDTWFVGNQAPPNQRRNIHGAGTYPVANVNASEYPTTPRERQCLDVIEKAGQNAADRHSSLTSTFYCEIIYGFAAVAARVPVKLTPDNWRAAYYSFGTAYPAITSFASNLSNGRNDNPELYRIIGYREGCQCVSYLSEPRKIA